ncbi:hypothetical protein AVEN_275085-1 [Araneus ventricosus]|uniref:Uncharacterized protein n=1 Tax=Araneus ventricosus TaxID=182803 RepID=A0A4Y2STV4_ARAVE|nr:hypothetical protein AVEN_275085-1 [Araneus ventricosus]
MKLTEAEKNTITHSLKMKIDIPVILEKLRNDMIASPTLARVHLMTRQDIKNNQRNFSLSVERHRDNAISVRLMIKEMAIELGMDSSSDYSDCEDLISASEDDYSSSESESNGDTLNAARNWWPIDIEASTPAPPNFEFT